MKTIFKIFNILDHSKKKFFLFLIFLMLIATLFEMIGIGLILPIMDFMIGGELGKNFTNKIFNFLNINNPEYEVFFLLLFLFIIYSIKISFLTFLSFFQSKFSFSFQENLSKKLFFKYLNLPYLEFIEHNSSELLRNLNSEVIIFSNSLRSLLLILSEFLVINGLLLILVFLQPYATILSISIIVLFALIIYRIISKTTNYWGIKRHEHEKKRIQSIQEGFGAFKEIRVANLQKSFLNYFDTHNKKTSEVSYKHHAFQGLPSIWLEYVGIVLIISLLIFLSLNNYDAKKIVPLLALVAATSFRLIPSFSRIITSYNQIKFSKAAIDNIYNELFFYRSNNTISKKINIKFNKEIKFENIFFKYSKSKNYVFKNFNLHISKGQIIGIMGKTGSGKSTFIDLLTGLIPPEKGQVLVDSININHNNLSWQSNINYVPQNIFLTDDTIKNNILLGASKKSISISKIKKIIKICCLDEWIDSLPKGINTNVGERGVSLSGGQKQRIGIARALIKSDRPLLIFDETTSAIDISTEMKIFKNIKKSFPKVTQIIISHRTNLDLYTSKIIYLKLIK